MQRAIVWEEATAIALLNTGANIVVLRHPKTVELVKAAINKLMSA
jgi:CO dehydrogenase/acetyl-CoA synthase delta subunit